MKNLFFMIAVVFIIAQAAENTEQELTFVPAKGSMIAIDFLYEHGPSNLLESLRNTYKSQEKSYGIHGFESLKTKMEKDSHITVPVLLPLKYESETIFWARVLVTFQKRANWYGFKNREGCKRLVDKTLKLMQKDSLKSLSWYLTGVDQDLIETLKKEKEVNFPQRTPRFSS